MGNEVKAMGGRRPEWEEYLAVHKMENMEAESSQRWRISPEAERGSICPAGAREAGFNKAIIQR